MEYEAELSRIRHLLPAPDSRSIEVGVGSGRFTTPLGVTVGIEPSRALGGMVCGRGIEVIRGRVEALPIKDASCSSVLLMMVICFLDNLHPAFRELRRILMPGGSFVLACIEREGKVYRRYMQEVGKGRFLSHAHFYSREEVVTVLERAGFTCQETDCRLGFCTMVVRADSG